MIPNPKYVNNVLRNWKNYQSYSFSVSNSLKYNLSFSMKFIQALLFMNVDDIIKGSDTLLNFVRSMFNVQKFDKIFPTDKASILIQDLLRFIHDISSTKTYSFVIFGKGRDFMQHMVLGSRFPLFNRLALRNVGYSSCNQAVIKTKFDEPDQYAVIYAHILGTLEYQRWSRKVGYKLNDETSCFSEFKFTEFIKKFNALSNDHSRVLKKFFSDLGWRQLI